MRASTRARSFLFLALSLGACGCMQVGDQDLDSQDPHQPGDAIGMFSVVGKLKNDSCGADNLGAPDKWSFELKLSREGNVLYWLNGREAIVGEIDKGGRFQLATRVEVPLSEARGASKGCVMVRRDAASGELTSSSSKLSGELSYSYDAANGSDCSALALGADGLPLALPCTLGYALSGSRVDD